ncbi:MAG: RNA polymerase sigma-70 factor [Gemmatimonadaceae bacterium]
MTHPARPDRAESSFVDAIRAGDETAFEALFRAYYVGLLRVALGYVRERGAAEDLVHDVLFRIWEQRAQWDVRDALPAYLYGAVRNRSLDYLRHQRVERRWRERVVARVLPIADIVQHPEQADAGVELNELDAAITRAVDRLPERCRQVFILNRQHGLTYAEVGRVMGISPKTVHVQMGRALKALRAAITPYLALVLALML